MTGFNLSAADIGRLDGGGVVSRTLEVKNRREVATLGIVRIKTSPSKYVERLADITTFKRTDDVLQVGTFSSPPQPRRRGVADHRRSRAEAAARVSRGGLRRAACPRTAIERVRREIDWRAADASRNASLLVRRLLVDYVARYRQSGAVAAMEYADRAPRLNVGQEFASLIDADTHHDELCPATASASARISSVFRRQDDRLRLLVQGARAQPPGHQHYPRRNRRRRGRFTGGLRHRLEADLRDALLRRLAWAHAPGAGSHGGIAGDVRRLLESVTNRYVRRSVRRGRAADCGRQGPGSGCGAARTTATSPGRRRVARTPARAHGNIAPAPSRRR